MAILDCQVKVPVMLFAAALALATGVLFGLFPALHSTRPDLITSIRAGAGRIAGGVAGHFRTDLAIAQNDVRVQAFAVIGSFGAFALGRDACSLLFGLEGHDPVVFMGAVLLLAAVAFGAGWIPARRASRTQPMMALRYD